MLAFPDFCQINVECLQFSSLVSALRAAPLTGLAALDSLGKTCAGLLLQKRIWGRARNRCLFLWGCRSPGQTCFRRKSAVWMLERLPRGCAGHTLPETPARRPGKFPPHSLRGLPGPGALQPCPPLRGGTGRAAPLVPLLPIWAGGRDAGPGRGRPQLQGVSRAMANVKVAVRVRPLSKRCGGARRDAEGHGGAWRPRQRGVIGCRWSCQPGRDRRPGAAWPGLREGRQALGSSAVRQEEWQPLAASLNSLESVLRKVTRWNC